MTDYGSDFAGVDDLDSELSEVSGARGVIESIARRYGCLPGSVEDDPNFGEDLTLLIGDVVDTAQVERKVVRQARLDDRVASATARAQQIGGLLEITMHIVLATGEAFTLILQVSALKVENVQIREAA